MPHAVSMPSPGFQVLIFCGPGVSFNTFTSNPEEFPKALIPIANRPMIWYPLDWCYRMGITSTFYLFEKNALYVYMSVQNGFITDVSFHESSENQATIISYGSTMYDRDTRSGRLEKDLIP